MIKEYSLTYTCTEQITCMNDSIKYGKTEKKINIRVSANIFDKKSRVCTVVGR